MLAEVMKPHNVGNNHKDLRAAARLADEPLHRLRRLVDEVGVLLAVEEAQRVGIEAAAAVVAEPVAERCVVGDQRLAVATPVLGIAQRIQLHVQTADAQGAEEPPGALDDLDVERR